jgi:hypothetical protein
MRIITTGVPDTGLVLGQRIAVGNKIRFDMIDRPLNTQTV